MSAVAEAIQSALPKHGVIKDGHPFFNAAVGGDDRGTAGVPFVLRACQITIREERFALRRDGSVLFGVLELAYGESKDGTAALGLRTANDKSMSIQICAGLAVFVCDILAFRGDLIALRSKHTSGLNIRDELATAVLRFQEHFERLVGEIETLKEKQLTDVEAKALMQDVFAGGSHARPPPP